MPDSLTVNVLRAVARERQPVLVPTVARRLGLDPDRDDLHPVRQVLNHLSRAEDGVRRAGKFGSFTYYEATSDVDHAIQRRTGRGRS